MSAIKIIIPFTPKPALSVRCNFDTRIRQRKGRGSWYNPRKRLKETIEAWIQEHLPQSEAPLLSGPLLVVCHFRMPMTASDLSSGVKRKRLVNIPHYQRPDGDNLEKFLNDTLTGKLWKDDSQIAWMLRSKSRIEQRVGQMELYVKELTFNAPDYADILTSIAENIRFDNDDRAIQIVPEMTV